MEFNWTVIVAFALAYGVYFSCGIFGQTPSGRTKSTSA